MMSDGGGMWFGGGFMWILWIVVIAIIAWVLKVLTDSGISNKTSSNNSPLEILKERYARGEIDDQEYERRRNELED